MKASWLDDLSGLADAVAGRAAGIAEVTVDFSLAMGIDTAFVSTHHLLRVVFMVTAAPLVFALIRKRLS